MAINVDISKITGINQVGNSYQRKSAVPLDYYSLFNTKAEAEAYAASNPVSYVGQVISYIDNNEVKVCVIADAAGTLKEVGKAPLAAANGAVEVAADGSIKVLVDDSTIKIVDNKLVASLPEMDNKSIESIEGKISMHDFGVAYYEYVPEEKNDAGEVTKEASYKKVTVGEGKPWKAGLEPKVVTEEGQLVIGWFEPNPTTIEGVNDQVTAVQGTVADLEQSVGVPSAEGQEATGLYKEVEDVQADVEELADSVGTAEDSLGDDVNTLWANVNNHTTRIEALEGKEDKDTTYTAKADDKVLSLNGTEFSTEIGLKHENGKISLTGKGGAVIAEFSDAEFVEDGVLQDVEYNDVDKTLTFTWNIIEKVEGDTITYKTDVIDISDLMNTYAAGNGLDLAADGKFSIKLAEGCESFLTVDENGLKLAGVQGAIDAAKEAAIEDAAGKYYTEGEVDTLLNAKANSADVYTKTAADELLANKANSADVYTKTEADGLLSAKANIADVYSKSETYTQKQVDDLLEGIQAGSSESAASVNTKLEALKKTLNNEIYGNDEGTGDSRIDTIESKLNGVAEGAQVNVIESVVVNNGDAEATQPHKLTATLSGKTVTLNDTGLQAAISEVRGLANEGKQAASEAKASASQNAQAIQTNSTDISNLKTLTGEHSAKIAALELADTTHAGEFSALNSTVATHGTDIASLKTGKADTSITDALAGRITANENALKTLNETTIPGINGAIDLKANSADVYDKTTIDTKLKAITDAAYDDTEVRELIGNNTAAIENIYKVEGETKSGVLVAEIARVEGLVSAEADRADKAEKALGVRIDGIDALLNTVDSEDNITSLKELATWVSEHGEDAAEMAEGIQTNAAAIAAIYTPATGEGETYVAASGVLVTEVARLDKAIADNSAADKKYTDDAIAALQQSIHGVDGDTIALKDNKAYVAKVSTDILVQGEVELIFSAGNASGYNTQA